ncbi:MAG: ABC transporter ATP-binding protein [Planctomycetota bacterium]
MSDVLIRAENVGKKFCRELKKSLAYGVRDSATDLLRLKGNHDQLRPDEFWANRDVSFELRRGECLGLLGWNGAGKTTLLKMLNGIIRPDVGSIEIRGRVGALIALGAGFNPILTGQENVFVNASILGFSKQQTRDLYEQIVEFSELKDFMNTPVRSYSSGMQVRLGFAIASAMDPDVLIVDEVLAVGDNAFRMKCLTRIGELLSNSAVILVSHFMPQIARICSHALYLEHGKTRLLTSNVSEAISQYCGAIKNQEDRIVTSTGDVEVVGLTVLSGGKTVQENGDVYQVIHGESLDLTVSLRIGPSVNRFVVTFSFIDRNMDIVANFGSAAANEFFTRTGEVTVSASLPSNQLSFGTYSMGIYIVEHRDNGSQGRVYLTNSRICAFEVDGIPPGTAPVHFTGSWSQSQNS